MFFLLFTFTLILGVTGGYLFSAGNELFGTIFIVASAVSLIFTIAYYASKRKYNSWKWDCLDCAVPDCDCDGLDCSSDCKPDCDCGGPNCD
ncbi:hypothetical protein HHO41_12430 [Bacillus sp. DNRA2]|uniref:hypothetical protein n=1 Tax=Bacillus sp. DNRA2 TaxID=2723053 RepID=UPI00145FC1A7|nr:hypothetical protein [Bacillus sp. DNRA2]NMD71105.1 hypothetical protein [Bacillus sp. DNRA2]